MVAVPEQSAPRIRPGLQLLQLLRHWGQPCFHLFPLCFLLSVEGVGIGGERHWWGDM